MKFRPGVVHILDVGAEHRHAIPNSYGGYVTVVPRHQLDYERTMLLGCVVGHQHAGEACVKPYVKVQIPVLLGAGRDHRPGDETARVDDTKAIWAVDADENMA